MEPSTTEPENPNSRCSFGTMGHPYKYKNQLNRKQVNRFVNGPQHLKECKNPHRQYCEQVPQKHTCLRKLDNDQHLQLTDKLRSPSHQLTDRSRSPSHQLSDRSRSPRSCQAPPSRCRSQGLHTYQRPCGLCQMQNVRLYMAGAFVKTRLSQIFSNVKWNADAEVLITIL